MEICPKCLKPFKDDLTAKTHIDNCLPGFSDIISREDSISIAHVTVKSSPEEKEICERISMISKILSGWDFPLLHYKNWLNDQVKSEAFLLLDGSTVLGYAVIRNHEGATKEFSAEPLYIVSDLFIFKEYRRKGCMRFLLLESLKSIKETFDSVAFMEPYTENGLAFLKTIARSLGLKTINGFRVLNNIVLDW
jgi:predicted acetyltransferase